MKLLKIILVWVLYWMLFAVVGNTFIDGFNYAPYSIMAFITYVFGVMVIYFREKSE